MSESVEVEVAYVCYYPDRVREKLLECFFTVSKENYQMCVNINELLDDYSFRNNICNIVNNS